MMLHWLGRGIPAQAVRILGLRLISVLGTLALMGISLLPLATLLLMLPAISPEETVLSESVRRPTSLWRRWLRRIIAVVAGLTMLIVLVAFALEVVTRLPLPETGYFENLIRTVMPDSLLSKLPNSLKVHWPYVLLLVYFTDLMFLLAIGRVPVRYNLRNLLVRWKITALTAMAFTVVIALLTTLLAFANGMYLMTENSAIPGNVVVLSDNATDELFSSLGPRRLNTLPTEIATVDPNGRRLAYPVGVQAHPDDPDRPLISYENFFVVTQPVPGNPERVRFLSVRGIADPEVATLVHEIALEPGGQWWSEAGAASGDVYHAVVGHGVAVTLGEDLGKPRLQVGDQFILGESTYEVRGVMAGVGSSYSSEIWAKWDLVGSEFNKKSYTSAVLRVTDNTLRNAQAMAHHLSTTHKDPELKAQTEKEYYNNLNELGNQFLYAIIFIVGVMAVGGVFGVMNTMFAAISQRMKDIGVLRILGFKRWQILVSFMLESLSIGMIGGGLGCAIGYLADGTTASSIMSGGEGSIKFIVLRLTVDQNILITGLLFTLVMARLGGLLPALSAMRLSILDSLR